MENASNQCPRCGHNYFNSKEAGLCEWCKEELDTIEPGQYSDDPEQHYNNCSTEIKRSMSEERRKLAADNLGPNWATILSGLGDQ